MRDREGKRLGCCLVAALLAVSLSACAGSRGEQPPPVELGRAPVSALIGMTAPEIGPRLGGVAEHAMLVTSVSLDDDTQVVVRHFGSIAGRSCQREPVRGYTYTLDAYVLLDGRTHNTSTMQMTFRDGRLSEIQNVFGGQSALAPNAEIVLACYARGRSSDPSQDFAWGALAIASAPFVLPQALSRRDARLENAAVFASLRLGEPVPGGLDALAAANPGRLTVAAREGESAVLRFLLFERRERPRYGTAIVREGRVTSLSGPGWPPCVLTSEHALQCALD